MLDSVNRGIRREDSGASVSNLLGLQGIGGSVWEMTGQTQLKPSVWEGVVDYRERGEIGLNQRRLIYGGGANDVFVHAFNMYSGMNDYLAIHENTREHIEQDGHTRYLIPDVAGKPARVVYQYRFERPIRKARLQTLFVLLGPDESKATIRIRCRGLASGNPRNTDWVTVYSGTNPNQGRALLDVTEWAAGNTEVEVEYSFSVAKGPNTHAQFARTILEDYSNSYSYSWFEALLEPGDPKLREVSSIPNNYASGEIGFRVMTQYREGANFLDKTYPEASANRN